MFTSRKLVLTITAERSVSNVYAKVKALNGMGQGQGRSNAFKIKTILLYSIMCRVTGFHF